MEVRYENNNLTSADLSYLWTSYMAESMSICVNKYFL